MLNSWMLFHIAVYALIAKSYGDYDWLFPLNQWDPMVIPFILLLQVIPVAYALLNKLMPVLDIATLSVIIWMLLTV
jgi:hypothetical protein